MPIVIFSYSVICLVLFFLVPDPRPLLTSPMLLVHDFSLLHLGQAITAGFLHSSLGHLLGNLVLLVLAGFPVERKLGSVKTLGLVVLSGLCALAMHVGSDPSSPVLFLGASGVVFGVLAFHASSC